MDARLETTRLLTILTDYARHAEECIDWWKLNQKEDFTVIKRWLEESENIVTRYPSPNFPSCTFTLVKNNTGTFKVDPFSRTWDKPRNGEDWRFSESEELLFTREFQAEELRGYRVNIQGLLHEIDSALGIKPAVDSSHFCFLRLGFLEGIPTYLIAGPIKTDFSSLFDLVMREGNNTVFFTIGSNNVTDFLKNQHKINIRDITDYLRIASDGSITDVAPLEKIQPAKEPAKVAKTTIIDKKGNQYLISEDCGSYYRIKDGKPDTRTPPIMLRPLAKAYLKILLNNVDKSIKRNELEKLALAELKISDPDEVLPSDTRLSEAFRAKIVGGSKRPVAIYNAIYSKKGWGGGSYMLPTRSVVKQ